MAMKATTSPRLRPRARVAYEFRPPEYFALAIFGLSMLASISSGGAVRNLIGGVFGVWLATIDA